MDTRDWQAHRRGLPWALSKGRGIPTARHLCPQRPSLPHGLAGGWDGVEVEVEVEGDGDSAKSPTNIHIDVELKGGEQDARL